MTAIFRGYGRFSVPWAFVCFLLALAVPVFPRGKQDEALAKADALIAEKKYDEAIPLLTQYARENPDKFPAAQDRFQRIVRARDRYYEMAHELLNALEAEPDNSVKILDLSSRIAAMEPNLDSTTQDFLDRVRQIAYFAVNRKRLEQILAKARAHKSQGDYRAAMGDYAGGLDMYQADFFQAGYGEPVESQVRRGIGAITAGTQAFTALIEPLNRSRAALEQQSALDAPPLARIEELSREAAAQAEQIIAIQAELEATGDYYNKELITLRDADKIQGDRSFLSFASRLLFGPADSRNEGMVGLINAYWEDLFPRIEEALFEAARKAYAAALDRIQAQEYPQSAPGFHEVSRHLEPCLRMAELWNRFRDKERHPQAAVFDQTVVEERAGHYLQYRVMDAASRQMHQISLLGQEFDRLLQEGSADTLERWRSGALDAEEAVTMERSLRSSYKGILDVLEPLTGDIRAQGASIRTYQARYQGDERVISYNSDALRSAEALRGRIGQEDQRALVRQYTLVNALIDRSVQAWGVEFEQAGRLINGVPLEIAGQESRIVKYPAEGFAVFDAISKGIPADMRRLQELFNLYQQESPQALNGPGRELRRHAQSALDRLNRYKADGDALIPHLRSRIAQAESLRQEGDRLYRESRESLARNDFNAARDRILRAGDRYDSSLAIQEAAALREERDNRLLNLGAEIARRENEYIVREVRGLVDAARTTYFAGNVERAEELLARAQNRWQVTNPEPDWEILYWLRVVRGAMTLRSGRTIAITAPLYAEMSQLLSNAYRSYEAGVKLLRARQRAEGIGRFNEARRFIHEIKLMFPVNQEAGILELRIDQVLDPDAFQNSFQRRLNAAVAGVERRSLQSFADLQNLAEINPRFPGIQNALVRAEIDMGYRQPPPDSRSLARSGELTASARTIIDRNVRAQFPIALEQLNQALALNPNNRDAMAQKDRVQTLLGGGTFILSSEAEKQYQQAVLELQAGNKVMALAIVRQLLQEPRNRNSTRLIELQRRIESVL
ncbi:MAG: hypothetical protein LBD37_06800 [Treponema sp.]|jgi:hypothetical protein|nr:hypothetical protein [Treponema sp.]